MINGLFIVIIFCGDLNVDFFLEMYSIVYESLVSVYSLICFCEVFYFVDEFGVIEFCNVVSSGSV